MIYLPADREMEQAEPFTQPKPYTPMAVFEFASEPA